MMTLDHAWNSLVTITFQSAALCLLAGVGLLLLRKSAAAARHFVLVLSLSALLTVPFLALVLPHWQVPLYASAPAPLPSATERTEILAQVPAAPSVSGARLLPQENVVPETASATAAQASPLLSPDRHSTHAGQAPVPIASAGAVHRAHVPVWQTERCRQAVLLVWLFGTTLALLRLVAGLIGTRRVTARETKSDPILSRMVAQIRKELGIDRPVVARQTVVGSGLPVPLTWGHFRPTVLLPPAFLEWPQERQRMVVLHEMAHIQRSDWLVQVLVQITLALYWFHPLVWWTTVRLQAESERACDDAVLLTGIAPSAYAETLVEVIRTMNRSPGSASPSAAMLSMAQPPIEARLQAILSPMRRQRPSRLTMLLSSAGAALCAVLLASVQVKAVPSSPAPVRPSPLPGVGGVTNAPLESAFPTRPVASVPELDASRQPADSSQINPETLATKSQESQEVEEIAMLRSKLDALELLLVQNQEENLRLRQQIKELEAGNNPLEDLERQKAALEAQAQRAEDRYRGPGFVSYQDGLDLMTEMDLCKLQIGAVQKQIDDVKAGRKVSPRPLDLSKLRVQFAKLEVGMAREQETRAKALTRNPVTAATRSDLLKADRKVALLQKQIDQMVGQYSQKIAH